MINRIILFIYWRELWTAVVDDNDNDDDAADVSGGVVPWPVLSSLRSLHRRRRPHSSLPVSDRIGLRGTPRPDVLRRQRTDVYQQVLAESRRVRRQPTDPHILPWSVPPRLRRSPSLPSSSLRLIRRMMSAVPTRPQRTVCDVWDWLW